MYTYITTYVYTFLPSYVPTGKLITHVWMTETNVWK